MYANLTLCLTQMKKGSQPTLCWHSMHSVNNNYGAFILSRTETETGTGTGIRTMGDNMSGSGVM